MSLICVVRSVLCDVACPLMCVWYGVYLLLVYRFHWFELCVLFCDVSCLLLLFVCMFCLWCVVLPFGVSLVCRACMLCCCCCLVFVFVLFFLL